MEILSELGSISENEEESSTDSDGDLRSNRVISTMLSTRTIPDKIFSIDIKPTEKLMRSMFIRVKMFRETEKEDILGSILGHRLSVVNILRLNVLEISMMLIKLATPLKIEVRTNQIMKFLASNHTYSTIDSCYNSILKVSTPNDHKTIRMNGLYYAFSYYKSTPKLIYLK